MTKVLVLGSNSFSGASFCAWLLARGIDVIGASRSPEPHSLFLPYRWQDPVGRFTFHQIDLNHDLDRLDRLMRAERTSVVVNFAAQSMVGESWQHPEHWMMTNVVALVGLQERLRHLDFLDKYVHVTTPEVYGSTEGWIDEDRPFLPSTPYAVSRAAGDMSLRTYVEAYGLPAVFTRAANVYGAGQQLYRIIPRTVLCLLTGRRLQLHGGGVATRSFIHIDDVSDATWRIAQHAEPGQTFHISTRSVVSIRAVVETLCERLSIPFDTAVDIADERLGKDTAYWLDSSRLRQQLGWEDRIGLDDGMTGYTAWARQHLATLRDLPAQYIHRP
jgi:dTDP-glucose 4,6-dehydratase